MQLPYEILIPVGPKGRWVSSERRQEYPGREEVVPEGPRWRDGSGSPTAQSSNLTVDLAGNSEVIGTVPNRPSGLGWLRTDASCRVNAGPPVAADGTEGVEHADMSGLRA